MLIEGILNNHGLVNAQRNREMRSMQEDLAGISSKITKSSTYSGFLMLNNVKGSTFNLEDYIKKPELESIFNKFRLTESKEMFDVVNIRGHVLELKDSNGEGTVEIKLNEPPRTGERYDLVMLEAWFSQVYAGEPIYKYGGISNGTTVEEQNFMFGEKETSTYQLRWNIRVVDGIDYKNHPLGITDFSKVAAKGYLDSPSEYTYKLLEDEKCLYIAGDGINTREELKSSDGYIYGIPLFIVKRRNLAQFSAANPSGGVNCVNSESISSRPDGLFSNIVYPRDIIDVRNSVSMSGFNYKALLDQEFDRFLRSDFRSRELLKTYHGIAKTKDDSNVVYYASFDGTTTPEKGGQTNFSEDKAVYSPVPTGLGLDLYGANKSAVGITGVINTKGTINLLVNFDSVERDSRCAIVSLVDSDNNSVYEIYNTGRHLKLDIDNKETLNFQHQLQGFGYVRVTWDSVQGKVKMYLNGNLLHEAPYVRPSKTVSKIAVGAGPESGEYQYNEHVVISDLSIKKIADYDFSHLPADVIKGVAQLAPAFNSQRSTFSEAQVSQLTLASVTADESKVSAGTSFTKVSKTEWAQNDTITLKGIAGEIISGVVDEAARLVRITKSTPDDPSPSIFVTDTTQLSQSDKVRIWDMINNKVSEVYTIGSIDASKGEIVLDKAVVVESGSYVIGETFVDSVPSTKLMLKIGTSRTVTGNWTGLGTTEAKFTLGEVPEEYKEATLIVQYSLNIPAKQRGIPQVVEEVLSGSVNGEQLFPQRTFEVVDDFKGKIKGSFEENPNYYGYRGATTLANPAEYAEIGQASIDRASAKGGSLNRIDAADVGVVPQNLFTFNLIGIIEQKFGEIKDIDKADWVRRHVEFVEFKWFGYNQAPNSTSKSTPAIWDHSSSEWKTYQSHSNEYVDTLSIGVAEDTLDKYMHATGRVRFLVYGAPAVSAEDTSKLYTDYVTVSFRLKGASGFTFLAPVGEEKKRRDYPVGNLLLLQPTTNTIQLYFGARENIEVLTYSEYIPLENNLATLEEVTILAESDGFLLTDITSDVAHLQKSHHWKNPLYRVRNDGSSLTGEVGFSDVPFAPDAKNVNIGARVIINGIGPVNKFTMQYAELKEAVDVVGIARFLVLHNGELKMWITSLHADGKMLNLDKSEVSMLVDITSKPLIKEVPGVSRDYILPTEWRTPSGDIKGYYDEFGNFIATYQ